MLYLYSFILALILANATAGVASNSSEVSGLDPSEKCQCFVVSGPEPAYFQNYRFYDFRSANPSAGRKASPRSSSTTGSFLSEEQRHLAPVESPREVPFTGGDWDSQAWRREGSKLFPIPIQNSPNNIFISQDDAAETAGASYLTMRTMRHQDFSSTAEMVSKTKNFLHCSVRIRLRLFSGNERAHPTSGEDMTNPSELRDNSSAIEQRQSVLPPLPGAVAGLFTYHSFTSESDIEILTGDPPNQIRYVNQPSYDPIANVAIPGAATTVSSLPVPWTEWSTHRLDWLPGMSRWYVNNMEQATKTYGVPQDPSVLALNLWSDGGVWSGNLTVGGAVHLGIEWIEIAYNTSSSAQGPDDRGARAVVDDTKASPARKPNKPSHANPNANVCMVGCQIDDPEGSSVKNLGNPQIVWDNRPQPEKAEQLSFDPIVIPNPLVVAPPDSEMQSDGGNSLRSHAGGIFSVVCAVVGVIATNFLFS